MYFLKETPSQECKRCLFDDTVAKIDPWSGICEYCQLHDSLEKNAPDISGEIEKLSKNKNRYNCLMGISGGLDSCVLLYMMVRYWNLRPLVIHLNNGWNTEVAEANMKNLCEKLSVERIVFYPDKKQYDTINDALLASGTPDMEIVNDLYMIALMYQTADRYNIKSIFTGHCYMSEGSTPRPFTYMDAKYLDDIYLQYTGQELTHFPKFTFLDQIKFGLKGIYQVRPYHDRAVYELRKQVEQEMKDFIGFQEYGPKHSENLYTEIVGSYILPTKFGIDKRIVYLSARVRSGEMTRDQAKLEFENPPVFDTSKIPQHIQERITPLKHPREKYKKYNFKKYRIVVWLLMKLGAVPRTMYVKYCK